MNVTRIAGRLVAVAMLGALPVSAHAAVSLTSASYSENFDSLTTNTGGVAATGGVLPNGWQFGELGNNANTSYRAGDGSSNTGDTYSFGAAGATDRALGALASGSLESRIGAIFTNATGNTITALNVAFFDEQWRNGSTTTPSRLAFSYLVGATDLFSTGSWTTLTALDLVDQVSGTTNAAVDGNSVRTQRTGAITGLTLRQGQTIGFRWIDLDDSGADDALAIDDFSMRATFATVGTVPEPSTWVMMMAGFGLVAGAARRRGSRRVLA